VRGFLGAKCLVRCNVRDEVFDAAARREVLLSRGPE
jgi:hypothetical protein